MSHIWQPQCICFLPALGIQYTLFIPRSRKFLLSNHDVTTVSRQVNPQFFTLYGSIKKDAFFTLKEFLSNIFKAHPPAVNVVSVIGDTWGISPNNTFELFTIYRAIAVFRVREMNKLNITEILPKWGESSSSLRLHINNNLTIIIFTGVSLTSCMFYFSCACATHLRHKEKKKKKSFRPGWLVSWTPEQLCPKPVKGRLFQSSCAKRNMSQISHRKFLSLESSQPTLRTFRVSVSC